MVVLSKGASVVGLLSFGTMTSLFSKIGARLPQFNSTHPHYDQVLLIALAHARM